MAGLRALEVKFQHLVRTSEYSKTAGLQTTQRKMAIDPHSQRFQRNQECCYGETLSYLQIFEKLFCLRGKKYI